MKTRRLLLLTAMTIMAAMTNALCAATSSLTPSFTTKIIADTTILTGQLKNGMTYYIKQNLYSGEKADVRIIVDAGTIDETPTQSGYAHLVEHLLFQSRDRDAVTNDKQLKTLGFEIGTGTNAATTHDYTTIDVFDIPTTNGQRYDYTTLGNVLTILSQMMTTFNVTDQDVDHERSVVLGEYNHEETLLAKKHLSRLAPAPSPYHDRAVIGDRQSITNATRRGLTDFYNTNYSPERMALVIVGQLEPHDIEGLITQAFAPIPQRHTAPRPTHPIVTLPPMSATVAHITNPEYRSFFINILTDDKTQNGEVNLDSPRRERDYIILQFILNLRNQNDIVNNRITSTASLNYLPVNYKYLPTYQCAVTATAGDWKTICPYMVRTIKDLATNGITRGEHKKLISIIKQYIADYDMYTQQVKGEEIEELTDYICHHNLVTSDQQDKETLTEMQSLTIDDINNIIKQYLNPERLSFTLYTDDTAVDDKTLKKIIDILWKETPTPTTADETPSKADDFIARAQKTDWQTIDAEALRTRLTHHTFGTDSLGSYDAYSLALHGENEPRIWYVPCDIEHGKMTITAVRRGGAVSTLSNMLATYPTANTDSLWWAAATLDLVEETSGWGTLTPTDVYDIKTATMVTCSSSLGLDNNLITIDGSVSTAPVMLAMLNETLSNPIHRDPDKLTAKLAQYTTLAKDNQETKDQVLSNNIALADYRHNPMFGYMPVDNYMNLNPQYVYDIYDDAHAGAQTFDYVIIGDFDITAPGDTILPMTAKTIASITGFDSPLLKKATTIALPPYNTGDTTITATIPGAEDRVYINHTTHLDLSELSELFDADIFPEGVSELLAEYCEAYLMQQLRYGDTPKIYSISVTANADRVYNAIDFTVNGECAPDVLDDVTGAIDTMFDGIADLDDETTDNIEATYVDNLLSYRKTQNYPWVDLVCNLIYGKGDTRLEEIYNPDATHYLVAILYTLRTTPRHRIIVRTTPR